MPGTSRSNAFEVALVALSARALARSARRAGLRALTFDLFADADTREHAERAVCVAHARRGFGVDRRALLNALREHAPEGLPVVFGAGFEHRPRLMAEIGGRNPIIGASPEIVARLKDPIAFAGLLADVGVRHPDFAHSGGDGWLSKRVGASGGWHIRNKARPARGRYAQLRVSGRPISALFLADGRRAQLVGLSEQWTDPTRHAPYRYGGAVGPIGLPASTEQDIADALTRIVEASGLSGLASADFMLGDDDKPVLLEINPRAGATLDVFDRGETPSLLVLHIEAAEGRLPGPLPRPETAQAAVTVYAPSACRVGMIPRPHWTADWPACDEIAAGAPFCTVLAAGPSPSAARALVLERRAKLLKTIEAAPAASQEQKASG